MSKVDLDTRESVTVREAGELTGLSRRTVQNLVATGELASIKLGGRRLVLAQTLRERLRLSETVGAARMPTRF